MPFEKQIEEFQARKVKALAMGGPEKLARRAQEGLLNARERIDHLVDEGAFLESGLFATSVLPDAREKTPADGKLAGFGKIGGREVAIVANDFTVMGASSSLVNGKKIGHMKETATRRGMPLVFLGESTGARMPDVMGATSMGSASNPTQYLRKRETPWVSAVLGPAFGSAAWYAAMSDFVVMRKGSVLAVSSPRLTSMATREKVDPEVLGGWRLHSEVTGLVDLAVETDQEALDAVKNFLSYLPSHHQEPPPRVAVPPGSDEAVQEILNLLPESSNRVYDVRQIIRAVADRDSFFELKPLFGKSIVTGFARLNGRSIGIVANNPQHKGGSIDADAADKATSFLVLCDSFNVPLVFLVDQPGFLIGVEAEKKGMPGKVMNWMNALALVTVPKISIILRKSYGQGYLNMGGGGNVDEVAAWWTADVSFMDPVAGTAIVFGIRPEDDPEQFKLLVAEMSKDTSAYDLAAVYGAQNVIDPRETRAYLARILEVHEMRLTGGVGEHLMRTWPAYL